MRKIIIGLIALTLVLAALPAWAVMSVTSTEITITSVKKVTFGWTSAADGTASGTTTATFDGQIIGLVTDPGATAPTDNYDIVINDADGVDVLLGAGANRDTANTEYVTGASLAGVAGSKLTLSITNAGDSKVGVVILYIR